MQGDVEQRLAICKAGINSIYNMLQNSSADWEGYLNFARSIITSLDLADFLSSRNRRDEQVWMISGMQRLAYHDADSGAVQFLADWCQRQWLRILQQDPSQVDALRGRFLLFAKVMHDVQSRI